MLRGVNRFDLFLSLWCLFDTCTCAARGQFGWTALSALLAVGQFWLAVEDLPDWSR